MSKSTARQLKEARKRGEILGGETGKRFWHRALSPKAKAHKRRRRRLAKQGRRAAG